jgi:hypothetical protein
MACQSVLRVLNNSLVTGPVLEIAFILRCSTRLAITVRSTCVGIIDGAQMFCAGPPTGRKSVVYPHYMRASAWRAISGLCMHLRCISIYTYRAVLCCVVLCCVVLCCAAGTEVFVRSGVLEGARAVSGVGFELGVACCVWSMEWWRLGK